MMTRTGWMMGALVGFSLALMSCQAATKAAVESEAPAFSELSPEEAMEMMQELSTPGEGHAHLEKMIGDWDVVVEYREAPGAEPMVSGGKGSNRWILGKRFVQTSYQGTMMGQPFEGMGVFGFNNATGSYESIWIDTFGTLIMPVSIGKANEAGVIELSRDVDMMGTGQMMTMREVWTFVDGNHHTLEMYMPAPGPEAEEFLAMRIRYTRAGS